MANDELKVKISLAKDGLAQQAADAAKLIQSNLENIAVDLEVRDEGVKLAQAAVEGLAQETVAAASTAATLQDAYALSPDATAALVTEVERLNEEARRGDATAELARIEDAARASADEAERLKNGFAAISVGAGALGAAIGAVFAQGLNASAEYARTLSTLESQIAATGGTVGLTTEQLQAFANDLGNATLTSEEAVLRASRALLSFRSVTGDTFTRTLVVAQDLSEVMGSYLESNILQLGKALEDPVKGLSALSRSGTTFTEQQKTLIKSLVESGDQLGAQQVILEELERQYGGAGIAAAAGLAGSLDTLGEETNDLIRTFGDFATIGAKPVVDAGIALLNTFNTLPDSIKLVLLGTTAFTGVLATAVAALAAYNFASGQKVIQDALSAAIAAKNTAATTANAGATAIATTVHNLYAVAIGKATAAQLAQTAALGKAALAMGAVAGAVAAVALVGDTFARVTGPARDVEKAVRDVDEALGRIAESGQAAGAGIAALTGTEAERNLADLEDSLGGVQRALDRVRGVIPGIPTAAEAASNRSQIAFNALISSTDDVRLAAAQTAVDLEKGVSIPPETVAATVAAIDQSIRALEAQQPVLQSEIDRRNAQVEGLKAYRERISETTAGVVAMGQSTDGLTDRLKGLGEALQFSLGAIDLTKLQAQAQILERLARGEISQDEADRQLGNVERLSLEDKFKAQREALADLRALRAKAAADSDEALELDRKIQAQESQIAQTRIQLARQVAEARKDAAAPVEPASDGQDALQVDQAIAGQRVALAAETGQTLAGESAALATAENTTARDRLRNAEKNLADLKRLQASGTLSPEEAQRVATQITRIEAEAARERQRLAEETARTAEEAHRERLRQIEAQNKAQADLAKTELEVAANRLRSLDRVADRLSREQQFLQAQGRLVQAVFELESSLNAEKRGQLEAILKGEESSQAQKRKAARDLIRATQEQFAREKDALEAKQALELQQFDLAQQQAALAQQRGIKEQELALKRLELQRLEIANEIELARLRGDDNAVRLGEAQLALLGEQAAAQQDYLVSLQQQAALSAELAQGQRSALLAQQEGQDVALAQTQSQTARGINEQVSGVDRSFDRRGDRLESRLDRSLEAAIRQARSSLPQLTEGINPQAMALASGAGAELPQQLRANLAQPIVDELRGMGARVEALSGSINALAASPRQLTVQTPDPVADTSRILSDISRQQTAGINP